MKKEMRRDAARMLARATQLGLMTKDGKPIAAVDLMEELLAAKDGFRNAHTYRLALEKRSAPALKQEHPEQSDNDYRLVKGRGVWVSMEAFVVHPYLTDEGLIVDVYGKGAESEKSLASCFASMLAAEEAVAESKEGREVGQLPNESIWRRKQDALEELGYEFKPDVDQPGLWVWTAPTDSCSQSFASEEAALDDAWNDATGQVRAIEQVSDAEWSAFSFEKQRTLLIALGED